MKKVYLLLITIFYVNISLLAQDIEVKKFKPFQNGQIDRINIRNDNNGNPCALLIVHSFKKGLEFEGWVVGDVEFENETYRIYVANGAKHIKIKHPDCQTKDVVFNEYGVNNLQSGTVYELYLVDGTIDYIDKVYSMGWNLSGFDIPENVKTYLRMSARRGDTKAMTALAQLSVEDDSKKGDILEQNQGFHWIRQLIEKGDSTCLDSMPGELMYVYAHKLLDGFRTDISPDPNKKDYSYISGFFLKACTKGYKKAGDDFFSYYIKGDGLPLNRNDVLSLCLDSASVGNTKAMTCLGHIFETGLCEEVDLKTAEEWYRKSDLCNPSTQSKTDLCRIYGNQLYPINDATLNYIRRLASEGLTEALFQMGCMYEEGRNVEKNIEIAIELFKKSKPTVFDFDRHSGATYHLAKIYYDRKDYKEAENLLMGLNDEELDARYLLAMILLQNTYNSEKVKAYNILSDLSKRGYQKAIDFIKNNY